MDLQALINSQAAGATLELPPGEFFEQVIIDKPLTIKGQGKSTWIGSRITPTIRITSSGVRLSNIMVENTAGLAAVAIESETGNAPVLESVIVKGLLLGVQQANIIDNSHADESPDIQISFLPPPPMSSPESSRPDSVHSPMKATASSPQSVAANFYSQGSALSTKLSVVSSPGWQRTVQSLQGIYPSRVAKIIGVGFVLILGLLAGLKYIDRGQKIDEEIYQKNRDEAAFLRLEEEVSRKYRVIVRQEQEIESLKKDKQRLEKDRQRIEHESSRLKAALRLRSHAGIALGHGATKAPEEDIYVYATEVFTTPKKSPVRFSHTTHKEAECTACHHEYASGRNVWQQGQEVKTCSACHKLEAEGKAVKLEKAYHDKCQNCHKALKREKKRAGPTACTKCHPV